VDGAQRGPEHPKHVEERNRDEVAGVEDQVGVKQPLDACRRQPPRAARQVGIGDDGDERPGSIQPAWNGSLMKTLVRAAFVAAVSLSAYTYAPGASRPGVRIFVW
jgi:hypothetical protein